MRIESTTCSLARCAAPQILQRLSVKFAGEEVAIAASGRTTIAMWDNYEGRRGLSNPSLEWAIGKGTRFAAARPVGAVGQDPVLLAASGRHIFVAWASITSGPLRMREWTGGSRLKRLASPADSASGQAPQVAIAGHDLVVAWAMNVDDHNLSAGNLPNGALSVASRPLAPTGFTLPR